MFATIFSEPLSTFSYLARLLLENTGWPKKVSHHQFKKIALKIANEIRFLCKVKV